jgi:hypothetical protein
MSANDVWNDYDACGQGWEDEELDRRLGAASASCRGWVKPTFPCLCGDSKTTTQAGVTICSGCGGVKVK